MPPPERVANVKTIKDGEELRAGSVTITAHKTGGHTPGGTSWTWRSCEDGAGGRCVDFVYADSMSAVSADGFKFTDNKTYPQAVDDFKKGIAFLRGVSCDILVTPHPEATDLWGRIDKRDAGARDALIDRVAVRSLCRSYRRATPEAARDGARAMRPTRPTWRCRRRRAGVVMRIRGRAVDGSVAR